jgi:phosphoglycolate phosphatase-like HAD superfamily hydrolase
VFLNERPYWIAAIRTALTVGGVALTSEDDRQAVVEAAIDEIGLHRVTKRRGCNSNWDLAVVLTSALRSVPTSDCVSSLLVRNRWREAAQAWHMAADRLWKRDRDDQPEDGPNVDPLEGFGLMRNGPEFERVRSAFQEELFHGKAGVSVQPIALRGDAYAVKGALSNLRRSGFALAVCTGRVRTELAAPMDEFELTPFFETDRLITADDVADAERALATAGLGKPHWFPLACAALGADRARQAVVSGSCGDVPWHRIVYVGDGLADFQAATRAERPGLPLEYVHVRSGVTDDAEERVIADAECTLGVVDGLADVIGVIRATTAGTVS